jgi:hypothetical protein
MLGRKAWEDVAVFGMGCRSQPGHQFCQEHPPCGTAHARWRSPCPKLARPGLQVGEQSLSLSNLAPAKYPINSRLDRVLAPGPADLGRASRRPPEGQRSRCEHLKYTSTGATMKRNRCRSSPTMLDRRSAGISQLSRAKPAPSGVSRGSTVSGCQGLLSSRRDQPFADLIERR